MSRQGLARHNARRDENKDGVDRYRWWVRRLRIKPTLAQHRACVFLSRNGQEFLVHFGVLNAVEKAQTLRYLQKRAGLR